MSYIDALADRIFAKINPTYGLPADERPLYRIYAVLCLAKGDAVTLEDVHDGWSAYVTQVSPRHLSLVPFAALSPEVQAKDEPYRNAIADVAAEYSQEGLV